VARNVIREDMADISVSIEGQPYGDSWNEAEGGNLSADSQKARAGGMGHEESAGGPASRGDLTVRIEFTDIVATWHPAFEEAVINSASIKVGLAWLGKNRIPLGTSTTRRGTVKEANLPDMGGGASVALYELVVDCDELAV
jgi:hypothetical protein